jgi:uncharacterized protein YebE (UPF0316 family)
MNLQSVSLLLGFFLLGLLTWALALWRTRACIAGMRFLVSGIVLIEETVGLLTIYWLVSDKNLAGAIAYAVGGALGAYLAMRPNKELDKKDKTL